MSDRASTLEGRVEAHSHPGKLQLIVATQGRCTASIEESNHSLEAPCVLYIPGGTVHSLRFDANSTGWVITASEQIYSFNAQRLEASYFSPLLQSTAIKSLKQKHSLIEKINWLMAELYREYNDQHTARNASMEALLKLILISLSREITDANKSVFVTTRKQNTFYRFNKLVEKNYRQHQKVSWYAQQLQMSAPQLNVICQKFSTITAHEILQQRVLLEAKRLLIYTAASALQISLELGFEDPAYFSRFFKQKTRQTPINYRKSKVY